MERAKGILKAGGMALIVRTADAGKTVKLVCYLSKGRQFKAKDGVRYEAGRAGWLVSGDVIGNQNAPRPINGQALFSPASLMPIDPDDLELEFTTELYSLTQKVK